MNYGKLCDKYGEHSELFKRYFLIKRIAKKIQERKQ